MFTSKNKITKTALAYVLCTNTIIKIIMNYLSIISTLDNDIIFEHEYKIKGASYEGAAAGCTMHKGATNNCAINKCAINKCAINKCTKVQAMNEL